MDDQLGEAAWSDLEHPKATKIRIQGTESSHFEYISGAQRAFSDDCLYVYSILLIHDGSNMVKTPNKISLLKIFEHLPIHK